MNALYEECVPQIGQIVLLVLHPPHSILRYNLAHQIKDNISSLLIYKLTF